jgi:hypothetical protein
MAASNESKEAYVVSRLSKTRLERDFEKSSAHLMPSPTRYQQPLMT